MASATEEFGIEELYDALANERRRCCLRCLARADADEPVAVREVAQHIADAQTSGESEGVEQSAYVSLVQFHLPKLSSYGIVEHDDDANLVAVGPRFATVYGCLRAHGGDAVDGAADASDVEGASGTGSAGDAESAGERDAGGRAVASLGRRWASTVSLVSVVGVLGALAYAPLRVPLLVVVLVVSAGAVAATRW